jgi:DNA-directed RNA polymerase specialized sigma24 family protein
MQTVSAFVQPRGAAADNRKPAALTARSRHLGFMPTSALDQLGLLVQSRPSGDASHARFKQNIVPQLDAAYNFARYLSRDADAAQDIVQEAFFRAYRSFAGYRGRDARAWVFTIVRNCYHNRSCRVWRARERRLGMPGAARQKILAELTSQSSLTQNTDDSSQIASRPVRQPESLGHTRS